MRARAPASSANLGPGFDALAVALALYVEVSVEPAERLEVHTSGCGSELPADANHLAAKIATSVAGHERLRIEVRSDIPVGRGLGSSAALAVASAAAAGAADPLAIGASIDGHPENAAASALGGLIAASTVGGRPVARSLPLDPELRYVVLIPDRESLTTEARAALPQKVSHDDAVFNLGRMGLLIAGLGDHKSLVAEAGDDRLHQDARSTQFREAPAILQGLREAGALTSCWSGAGPTLMAICRAGDADRIAQAASSLLEDMKIIGTTRVLEADLGGVTVSRGTS